MPAVDRNEEEIHMDFSTGEYNKEKRNFTEKVKLRKELRQEL